MHFFPKYDFILKCTVSFSFQFLHSAFSSYIWNQILFINIHFLLKIFIIIFMLSNSLPWWIKWNNNENLLMKSQYTNHLKHEDMTTNENRNRNVKKDLIFNKFFQNYNMLLELGITHYFIICRQILKTGHILFYFSLNKICSNYIGVQLSFPVFYEKLGIYCRRTVHYVLFKVLSITSTFTFFCQHSNTTLLWVL